jgi:hypothetical protein
MRNTRDLSSVVTTQPIAPTKGPAILVLQYGILSFQELSHAKSDNPLPLTPPIFVKNFICDYHPYLPLHPDTG